MSRLIDADYILNQQWFVSYKPYKADGTIRDADEVVKDVVKQCKNIVDNAPVIGTQDAKKPFYYPPEKDWETGLVIEPAMFECIACREELDFEDQYSYCPNCGQKIDWRSYIEQID